MKVFHNADCNSKIWVELRKLFVFSCRLDGKDRSFLKETPMEAQVSDAEFYARCPKEAMKRP